MTAPGSIWPAPEVTASEKRVIGAMLEHARHEDAATAARVSVRTLRRYLAREHVRRALSVEATRRMRAVSLVLARHAAQAADDLGRMATGAIVADGARVRACLGVLEQAARAVEVEDFARRLDELERGPVALRPGKEPLQ